MDTSSHIPGGAGSSPFRPDCVSGFEPSGSGSTSLKWGADGELTALDLHKVLARLCVYDPQVCEVLNDERLAG